ncbi:MAG: hypothetical protein COB38_06510 [Gammaproteobacteria bacterium]|nr:MAG: hypothetical protein COB38_06510 [Gammaproteobacteria bacterium]
MSSIYMYHAVGDEEQTAGADPYYAVSETLFCEHIKCIFQSQPLAMQLKDGSKINHSCITFDDGHLSNYLVAFPRLLEKKLSAEFYINTNMVGTEYFMSWAQLKEMYDAGMSIQSHGHNHHYFSDMTDSEITEELKTSKELIESNIGNLVTVFAPPGGRTNKRVTRIAKSLGYKCIANSRPGIVPFFRSFEVPRFAILKHTNTNTIMAWKSRWSLATIKEVIRYRMFRIAKLVLGNKRYEKIRMKLLTGSE